MSRRLQSLNGITVHIAPYGRTVAVGCPEAGRSIRSAPARTSDTRPTSKELVEAHAQRRAGAVRRHPACAERGGRGPDGHGGAGRCRHALRRRPWRPVRRWRSEPCRRASWLLRGLHVCRPRRAPARLGFASRQRPRLRPRAAAEYINRRDRHATARSPHLARASAERLSQYSLSVSGVSDVPTSARHRGGGSACCNSIPPHQRFLRKRSAPARSHRSEEM